MKLILTESRLDILILDCRKPVCDNGIESFSPFCKSKITLPNSRRTSSGNSRMASRAFGWNTADFTWIVSQMWNMVVEKD